MADTRTLFEKLQSDTWLLNGGIRQATKRYNQALKDQRAHAAVLVEARLDGIVNAAQYRELWQMLWTVED